MIYRCFIVLAIAGTAAGLCEAAPQIVIGTDPRNTLPGVVANGILVDGEGLDWFGADLVIELTAGSVYNGDPDTNQPQQVFWDLFPDLQFDTWVGVPGDLTNSVHGGAVEFAGGPLSMSGQTISVEWFNITVTNTDLTQIANISLTDDAQGTMSLFVLFAGGTSLTTTSAIVGGALSPLTLPPPFPEPTSLALLGVMMLNIIRRQRNALQQEVGDA